MIWTTTPWTLPANLGDRGQSEVRYALVRIDGNVTVIATELVEKVTKAGEGRGRQGARDDRPATSWSGCGIGTRSVDAPPPCGLGRKCDARKVWTVVAADYVTLEDGTGLVHTAPGHGTEDYSTGLREGLPVYCPVKGDGTYDDTVPEWLRGVSRLGRQREGHRAPPRLRPPLPLAHVHAQLSARLAQQDAGDLPLHGAVVCGVDETSQAKRRKA